MEDGAILGHEPMGVVVEVGKGVTKLKKGDRVVVPFVIACGTCFFRKKGLFAACDTSNPNAEVAKKAMGQSPAGLFGFSHMLVGFAGGQAEYLRVPFADVGPIVIESDLPDEKVLFLSDIFPTGYMADENAEIEEGDTVAVWGCGPVAQMAIQGAWLLGAGRVIAIDHVPERLAMAQTAGRAETIDSTKEDVYHRLMELTHGRGPDRCIDAVGCEAHAGGGIDAVLDKVKAVLPWVTLLHRWQRGNDAGTASSGGLLVRGRLLHWWHREADAIGLGRWTRAVPTAPHPPGRRAAARA